MLHNNPAVCPYLELADARCGQRFTLDKLDEAYRYCVGHPKRCPVYRILASELVVAGAAEPSDFF